LALSIPNGQIRAELISSGTVALPFGTITPV
jgi:hypothetical protein